MEDSESTTRGPRHTTETRLCDLGLGWQDIGAITGHETAAMTRTYSERRRRAENAPVQMIRGTAA